MTTSEFGSYLKTKYPQTSSFTSGLALFFVDAIILILSIGFGFFIVNLFNTSDINFKSFINYSIYIPFILLIFGCIGLYPGIMNSPTQEVKKFFFSCAFSFVAIILTIIISDDNTIQFTKALIKDSEDIALSIAFIISIPVATIALPGFREFGKHFFCRFRWWGVPTVIYTDGNEAKFIIDKLIKNKYLGYHPAVIISSNTNGETEYKGIPIFAPSDDVGSVDDLCIDVIFVLLV